MGWVILGLVLLLAALNVPIGFTLAIATILAVLIQGTAPLEAIPLMLFGGASMFFGEISGSAVAGAAAIGQVVIPAMAKKGYPKAFSAAVVSNAATLAIIIPPSIPMIIYAAMADTSVVKLFISGVVPGILGGGLMMALSYYFARTRGYPVETAFSVRTLARGLPR